MKRFDSIQPVLMIPLVVLLMSSCGFFDSTDAIPMYFKIDEVSLETTAEEGINTHSINGLAAFADGASIGVYSLPANIPVLQSDEELDFDLIATIKNNGIASNPVAYPFYETKKYEFLFEENATKVLMPVFEYSAQSKQIIVGDFETANPFVINVDNNPDIGFERSTEAIYGNFCGKITLTEDHTDFTKTTFTKIDRSTVFGSPLYLELDYKNEVPFIVGVLQNTISNQFVENFKVELSPSEDWNKVYIEMTDLIADNQVDKFTVLLGSSRSNSDLGSIWIDNVKLVHF